MFVASSRNTERGIAGRTNVPQIVRNLHERLLAEHEAARPRPKPVVQLIPLTKYQRIERRACRLFRVTGVDLRCARRTERVVMARQFVAYWSLRLTTHSAVRIGRFLGGRDHTTILHGKRAYVAKRAKMGRSLRSL